MPREIPLIRLSKTFYSSRFESIGKDLFEKEFIYIFTMCYIFIFVIFDIAATQQSFRSSVE